MYIKLQRVFMVGIIQFQPQNFVSACNNNNINAAQQQSHNTARLVITIQGNKDTALLLLYIDQSDSRRQTNNRSSLLFHISLFDLSLLMKQTKLFDLCAADNVHYRPRWLLVGAFIAARCAFSCNNTKKAQTT